MKTEHPVKDEESAHPIPHVLRPVLKQIVKQFIDGDYSLQKIEGQVAPVSPTTARHIENNIADYGETLIELPDETWSTSVSQWMIINWELVVDLWTAEAGRSDLVLNARVCEKEGGFEFIVDSVHVP